MAESAGLRKRPPLSINTSRTSTATAASADAKARERELKGVEEPRTTTAAPAADMEQGEPMSPAGRLFHQPGFNCHIVAVMGSATPIDVAAVRAGLEATLVRHPRFCSIQELDESKHKNARWVRAKVNVDDHIIIPDLDPTAISSNPDKLLEDYVAALSTTELDFSRPLWAFHVLNFPTSEAAAACVLHMHHSLGDGTSLLSLLLACTRSATDPTALPALPPAGTRSGPVFAPPRLPLSAGIRALLMWVLSFVVLAWHTVVDVANFIATSWFLKDADSPFKGAPGVEYHPKRFVHRALSLDDVKHVKNALRCTVNDVLLGVTSAALSRYYYRKCGDTDGKKMKSQKKIRLRSTLLVNIRPTPGLHTMAQMMETGKNGAKWGNQLGYIILPFPITMYGDPLDYVRKGKEMADRKKSSFEAIFTHISAKMIIKLFGIKAAGALSHGVLTNTTFSFSNMIGPVEQILLAGHPMVYLAPSVYGHPQALTVHYQSFMNTIRLVLAVDETLIPDPHQLLDDFAESLKLIKDAASTMS